MSLFRSPKMWKSQGKRSGLYGGCWSVSQSNHWSLSLTRLAVWGRALSDRRMIPSDSIPGHFDFVASQHAQPPRNETHLSALLCLPPFPMLNKYIFTTLTSRAIKKQLCGPVRLHYPSLLPYRCQYRYVTSVASFYEEWVLWGLFTFHLTHHHHHRWHYGPLSLALASLMTAAQSFRSRAFNLHLLRGATSEISNFSNFSPRLFIFGTHIPSKITIHAGKFQWCVSHTF